MFPSLKFLYSMGLFFLIEINLRVEGLLLSLYGLQLWLFNKLKGRKKLIVENRRIK